MDGSMAESTAKSFSEDGDGTDMDEYSFYHEFKRVSIAPSIHDSYQYLST